MCMPSRVAVHKQASTDHSVTKGNTMMPSIKHNPAKLSALSCAMFPMQVSLFDIMPSMCVADMARAVEEYARR